ncbi:MAG: Uma2 family endonuclease [Opitutaceae bacterium]
MSEPYEETIHGEDFYRSPPNSSHELLVARLHRLVANYLPADSGLKVLPPRTELNLGEEVRLQPDLCIMRLRSPETGPAEETPYLVAEVLLPGDHHTDTVVKKQLWSDIRLPRLWMVDPRYLNVEIYASTEFGFTLLDILANRHPLTDPNLPGLSCPMRELFADI